MRSYENKLFDEIVEKIHIGKEHILSIDLLEKEFTLLQHYLTRHFYYSVIVDDYLFEIIDKESLLEALYYQIRLVTMHGLNWDAFEEALNDALNNFKEFEGICLLFKNKGLRTNAINEFTTLSQIIKEINKHSDLKHISLIFQVESDVTPDFNYLSNTN